MKKKLAKQRKSAVRFLTPSGDWIDVPGCAHYTICTSGEIVLKNYEGGTTLAIAPKGSSLITNWKSL
jgi:hypothetical protein